MCILNNNKKTFCEHTLLSMGLSKIYVKLFLFECVINKTILELQANE